MKAKQFSSIHHILILGFLFCLLLQANFQISTQKQAYTIKTIAGFGVCDGNKASEASLFSPTSSRMNSLGELILVDFKHNRIRKILNNGSITTIAGNGFSGYNGDGILATEATLNEPYSVAIDANDEVYFSDTGNNRIRKILNNGTIINYAGSGFGSLGDGDLAIKAQFSYPKGIYIDQITGNLYISDRGNHRIRKVSNSTGIITTIAGTGQAGFSGDGGLAIKAKLQFPDDVSGNAQGEIYIADSNARIRRILTNGTIDTFASGVGGVGVFCSSITNEVFIVDNNKHRIRKVLTNGKIITIAGNSPSIIGGFTGDNVLANSTQLNSPSHVFESSDGSLFISDSNNNRIRKVFTNGTISTIAGSGSGIYCKEGVQAMNGPLGNPKGLFLNSNGELYIAEYEGHRVRKILNNGMIITIAGTGSAGYNGDGIKATSAMLNSPSAVAEDTMGQVYISDTNNCRIRKILTNGTITTIAGTGSCGYNGDNILAVNAKVFSPLGIAVTSVGIFFADSYSFRVRKILTNGTITTYAGTGAFGDTHTNLATTTEIHFPTGVSFDENDSSLYFSDTLLIYQVFSNNSIKIVVGNGQTGYIDASENVPAITCPLVPGGINILNATLFIADTFNERVRIVSNGIISTVAGNGLPNDIGLWGEEVLSTKAIVSAYDVVIKPNGEIMFSDAKNNLIRKLTPAISCNDFLDSEPGVCNGHGKCIGQDKCVCDSGYTDTFCQFPLCNNISSSTYKVCNRRGKCVAPDVCECDMRGYYGKYCQNTVYCFNSVFNAINVCHGKGACVANDVCVCKPGYTGISCGDYSSCFGILSNETRTVCSGHGKCISNDTCSCNVGWFGSYCNITKCFDEFTNSSTVCNGHGICNSLNNCTCEKYWTGLNCSTFFNTTEITSNNVVNSTITNNITVTNMTTNGTLNSTIISNVTILNNSYTNRTIFENTTITSNTSIDRNHTIPNISNTTIPLNNASANSTIICFGIEANNTLVCNSNGKCKSKDNCECYSNANDGYFTSETCSNCQMDYYGKSCLTSFIGPLILSNESNGVEIKIVSPYWYKPLNIPCSDLIHSEDLKLFGNTPNCFWKEKGANLFFIEFGNDFGLLVGDSIRFNTFAFETSTDSYLNFIIEPPLNAIRPIAIISTTQVSYSTCEHVIIDASNSYSLDRKPLSFIWSIIQSPNYIQIYNNGSILTISDKQSSLEGVYIVRLQVESSFTKTKSELIDFKFTKSNTAFPILMIDTPDITQINVKTLNVPIIIEKKVSFPSCYSNMSASGVAVEWNQIGGNEIEYHLNSNSDLVITNFPIKGSNKYAFNVTALFEGKSASTDVTIQTTSENLFSNLYIESLTTSKATITIESRDVEQSSEIETWTISCIAINSQNGCGNLIDSKLSNYAALKQSSFELNSGDFPLISDTFSVTLTINKGYRSVSSSLQIQFPKEAVKLPPLISLLNVAPNRKKLTLNDILNLQLSVTKSDGTDLINIVRNWTLNGESIPPSYLGKMSSPVSSSNSIILEMNNLVEDSSNVLSLKAIDLDTQLSDSYSYSFTIEKSPQACPYSLTPSTGYALETDFTFTCSNCQNKENSLTFSLSFLDDKSGATIPIVVNGKNTYTTKLPYPSTTPLVVIVYVEIVDSDTGASVKSHQKVPILLPLASSVKEVKTKTAKWNAFQNSLQQNDLRRLIFSSAIISRTSDAMIAALSKTRRRSLCLNGGIFNTEKSKCICMHGYAKKDCSLTVEDFIIVKEFKKELFNNFFVAFEKHQGKITQVYLIYQLFGLDSLLSSYDDIDQEIFDKSLGMLKNLVFLSNENENLRVGFGVDVLFSNIFNSLHNYLIFNECGNCQDMVLQFGSLLRTISQILIKSKYIGESDLKMKVQFTSLLTNRNYKYHFKNMKTTFDPDTNITLTFSNEQASRVSSRVLWTFIATMIPNYLNELSPTLISQTSQITQNRNTSSSLFRRDLIVSNLISFELKDVFLNHSLGFSFKNSKNIERKLNVDSRIEYSCIVIQNYTNLIMNNDCKFTMDEEHFYCSCSNLNNNQIAILKSEFIEESEIKHSNDLYYLLFLLFILVIIFVVVVLLEKILSCNRKKKEKPQLSEVELSSA